MTNNGNTGSGTFRDAVETANTNSAIDTIQFDDDYSIGLQSEVLYTGTQDLHIEGNGSTLTGDKSVDTDTWNSGLFVAKGCASLTIENLSFADSFNNGLAVFLGVLSGDTYTPCSKEVSIELHNADISNSQFFGALIDGQATTGFNTDDIIHHACQDPWPYDVNAPISVNVTDSKISGSGQLDGDYDISLTTGCPQDFDGLRVDQGGDGDLHADIVDSRFYRNLADGVELDEKGDGSVEAAVGGSTFNANGDTVEIECTQAAHDAEVTAGDEDICEIGKYIQDLDDGFDIDEEGEGDMIAQVSGTEVIGNHDEGLDFDEADEGSIDVDVDKVTAIANYDEALKASEEGSGNVVVTVKKSSFTYGGDDGTQIEQEDDGEVDVEVKHSTISYNAKSGVKVEASDDGSGKLVIKNTNLSNNADGPYDTDDNVTVKVN